MTETFVIKFVLPYCYVRYKVPIAHKGSGTDKTCFKCMRANLIPIHLELVNPKQIDTDYLQ